MECDLHLLCVLTPPKGSRNGGQFPEPCSWAVPGADCTQICSARSSISASRPLNLKVLKGLRKRRRGKKMLRSVRLR